MITFEDFLAAVEGAPDIALLHRFACEAPAVRTTGFVDMDDQQLCLHDFDDSEEFESASDDDDDNDDDEDDPRVGGVDANGAEAASSSLSTAKRRIGGDVSFDSSSAAAADEARRSGSIGDPQRQRRSNPNSPMLPGRMSWRSGAGGSSNAEAAGGSIVEILSTAAPSFPHHDDGKEAAPQSAPSSSPTEEQQNNSCHNNNRSKMHSSMRGKSRISFIWGDFGTLDDQSSALRGQDYMDNQDDDAEEEEETLGGYTYRAPKKKPTVAHATEKPQGAQLQALTARRVSLAVKSCDELEDAAQEEEDDASSIDGGDFYFGDFVVSRADPSDSPSSTKSALFTSSSSPSSSSSKRTSAAYVDMQPEELFMFGDFVIPGAAEATGSLCPHAALQLQGGSGTLRVTDTNTNSSFAESVVNAAAPAAGAMRVPGAATVAVAAHETPQPLKRGDTALGATLPVPLPRAARAQLTAVTLSSAIGHRGRIRGIAFGSASESTCISCGGEETPVLRGIETSGLIAKNELLSYFVNHTDIVLSVSVTFDFKFVAFASNDCTLSVYEVTTTKKCASHHHPGPVICATFSRNGKFIVSGCQDGACRLWSSKKSSKAPIATYFGHKLYISAIKFQPNGEIVASASGDKTVHLWNGATSKTLRALKGHKFPAGALDFTVDGQFLLSLCKQTLLISKVADGSQLMKLSTSQLGLDARLASGAKFTAALFCPQQHQQLGVSPRILVATSARTVSIHETTGLCERELESHSGHLFSPGLKGAPGNLTSSSSNTSNLSSASNVRGGLSRSDGAAAVRVTPPVWDTVLRSACCIAACGPRNGVLLGDVHGNVTKLTLR